MHLQLRTPSKVLLKEHLLDILPFEPVFDPGVQTGHRIQDPHLDHFLDQVARFVNLLGQVEVRALLDFPGDILNKLGQRGEVLRVQMGIGNQVEQVSGLHDFWVVQVLQEVEEDLFVQRLRVYPGVLA